MANAIGWSREDLEAAQAVDFSAMLHTVPPQHNEHDNQQHAPELVNTSNETFQGLATLPNPFTTRKVASPVAVPLGEHQESGTPVAEPKILGLRRTTFFLTVSNILLAIGLVVLGVAQNQVLRSGTSTLAGPETQGTCPSVSVTPSGTSTSMMAAPTCTPEAGKICFATDKSITTAVAMGDVIAECPLPDNKTNYTVPGTDLKFRRVCETDYPSGDMGQFPVISMADCIQLCAQLNLYPASARGRCVGASWVYADGPQGTGLSFCYPKSVMKVSNPRAATESALLIVN